VGHEGPDRLGIDVGDGQRPAGLEEVTADRATHPAASDEADAGERAARLIAAWNPLR
jgi:hypothetical protein